MMLGKLPVSGCPAYLDNSRISYCTCSRCGWGLFGHFLSRLLVLSSFSLWEKARYRLNYCLKRPFNPKQPTNQILTGITCECLKQPPFQGPWSQKIVQMNLYSGVMNLYSGVMNLYSGVMNLYSGVIYSGVMNLYSGVMNLYSGVMNLLFRCHLS